MPRHLEEKTRDLREYTYIPQRLAPGEEIEPEPTAEQVAERKARLALEAGLEATHVLHGPVRHVSRPVDHWNQAPVLERTQMIRPAAPVKPPVPVDRTFSRTYPSKAARLSPWQRVVAWWQLRFGGRR